ncbi:MAG: aspartyl-phosphate phosphatase Spo0E family protein [Bacillota bacterium]
MSYNQPKCERDKIDRKINKIRKELFKEFDKNKSFKDERVYNVSKKLDKEIYKYMKNNFDK